MTQTKHTLTVRQACDTVYIIDEHEHEVANMSIKSDYQRAHLFAAAPDLKTGLLNSQSLLAQLFSYKEKLPEDFLKLVAKQRKTNFDTLNKAEGIKS